MKKDCKIKGFFKSIFKPIKIILCVVIILAVITGVFYLGTLFKDYNTTYNTKTTKLGFEDVGELVTQTGYLTIVEDTKTHRTLFKSFKVPFTESRQIFSYDVEVDASVDFSKISYKANDEKKEIEIKLPHSKIYKVTLDLDSLNVYLDTESLFSRIDLKKHNEAIKKLKEQAVADSKANGILTAADKNAKKLINGFVKSNEKYKDYKVIYKYVRG